MSSKANNTAKNTSRSTVMSSPPAKRASTTPPAKVKGSKSPSPKAQDPKPMPKPATAKSSVAKKAVVSKVPAKPELKQATAKHPKKATITPAPKGTPKPAVPKTPKDTVGTKPKDTTAPAPTPRKSPAKTPVGVPKASNSSPVSTSAKSATKPKTSKVAEKPAAQVVEPVAPITKATTGKTKARKGAASSDSLVAAVSTSIEESPVTIIDTAVADVAPKGKKKKTAKSVPEAAPVASHPEPVKVIKPKAPAQPVFVPRPVKPVKGPAINADDPFDGIDELSDGQFLWQQIELLKSEREHYLAQAAMLRAEADQLAVDMEPGDVQFDDESGEGATTGVERERDLAMSASAIGFAEEIERLLLTIENGSYGYCESCHKAIVRARLRAMPAATLCVACKSGGLSRR